MSGRATRRVDGRHQVEPPRREPRGEDGHLDDREPLAAKPRDALDHLAVRHDLRARHVERPSVCRLLTADAGKVRDDVAQRDRLRGVETQRGQTIAGSRSTSARIVSKAALPAPTTIPARSVVTGTGPAESRSAVSARLRRCADSASDVAPSPPR